MRKNQLLNNKLQNNFIKNLNQEELEDSTFNLWKIELQKELPMFWESLDEPIKPRRRFSHSS